MTFNRLMRIAGWLRRGNLAPVVTILWLLGSASSYADQWRDTTYVGVYYFIDGTLVAKQRRDGDLPSPAGLAKCISAVFHVAIEDADDAVPACVRTALKRYREDLRAGTRKLRVRWVPYAALPPNAKWTEMTSGVPIVAGATELNDPPPPITEMVLEGAPCAPSSPRPDLHCVERSVATFFHELVHAAWNVHPECFKSEKRLNKDAFKARQEVTVGDSDFMPTQFSPAQQCDESWTDDAKHAVYPDSCTSYTLLPNCHATFHDLCTCGPDCPCH